MRVLSIASVGKLVPNLKDLARRILSIPLFLVNAHKLITLDTPLIFSDAPVNVRTHSSSGFKVLTKFVAR
jgi:hypothetical protein